MSSNPVELSSEHSDSQNYVRDTPANQRLVDDSQTATSAGPRLGEVTEAALINPSVAQASSSLKKKKKRSLVKGVKVPITGKAIPSAPSTSAKGKDRGGEVPNMLRNSLPVKLDPSHLLFLREYFTIPYTVEMRLPSGSDQVF
ncbi:hypothetical protein LIER_10363 [Lithospermum erythrorhizon]|uniref:Uncharacterized protein n=1 Tax=Lithospermum erythrorhizon TaxID=34254 RepID=A0AAV3PIX6_LITER